MFILDNGENIVKVVRRHWFVMLSFALSIFIMAVAPVLLYIFSIYIGLHFPEIAGSVQNWIAFLYSIWLLILWTIFFIEWTDYYLDVLIITDKRVVNVEQKGFFHREVISFRYEQIQDITVETRGVIQTFFKFGLMQIQTAGEKRCIIIKHANNPEEARRILVDMQGKPTRSIFP